MAAVLGLESITLDCVVERYGGGGMGVECVRLDELGECGDVDTGLQAVRLHVVGERDDGGMGLERARKMGLGMVVETVLGLVARGLVAGMTGRERVGDDRFWSAGGPVILVLRLFVQGKLGILMSTAYAALNAFQECWRRLLLSVPQQRAPIEVERVNEPP